MWPLFVRVTIRVTIRVNIRVAIRPACFVRMGAGALTLRVYVCAGTHLRADPIDLGEYQRIYGLEYPADLGAAIQPIPDAEYPLFIRR